MVLLAHVEEEGGFAGEDVGGEHSVPFLGHGEFGLGFDLADLQVVLE